MFTLDIVAGNRARTINRLVTTLRPLTSVKQGYFIVLSSEGYFTGKTGLFYYTLVRAVTAQIRASFGFVGTRHVKALQ